MNQHAARRIGGGKARRRLAGAFVLVSIIVGSVIAAVAAPVAAHNRGQSYVYLDVTDTTLGGRVELSLVDITEVLGIEFDNDVDNVVRILEQNKELLQHFADDHFTIGSGAELWSLDFAGIDLLNGDLLSSRWGFAVLPFVVEMPLDLVPRSLTVGFDAFLDEIPGRDAVVLVSNDWRGGVIDNESEELVVFDGDTRSRTVDLGSTGLRKTFVASIELGVDHIRTGPDHIFFVLVLLLPAVLIFKESWEPADRFGAALWRVLKIATMFTIAHSLTFTLAGLELLPLPSSRIVESIIALSIAVAALHNLRPIAANREWVIAFAFGLFHGMGFASLVGALDVSRATQLVSLLGRNVGIEIGQAVVILLVFPGLFVLRSTRTYRPFFVLSSIVLASLASVWTVERVFLQDFNISGLVDDAILFPRVLWLVVAFSGFAVLTRLLNGRSEQSSDEHPSDQSVEADRAGIEVGSPVS